MPPTHWQELVALSHVGCGGHIFSVSFLCICENKEVERRQVKNPSILLLDLGKSTGKGSNDAMVHGCRLAGGSVVEWPSQV